MSCPHVQHSVKLPSNQFNYETNRSEPVVIHKEECTKCFDDDGSDGGINVCMTCFNGGCSRQGHGHNHATIARHPIVLNIRKTVVAVEQQPQKSDNKSFVLPSFESQYTSQARCLTCNLDLDMQDEKVKASADAILKFKAAAPVSDFVKFDQDALPCMHCADLPQIADPPILEAKGLAHCQECSVDFNLWLCLTCGHLGCSRPVDARTEALTGQKGGNGHALEHFIQTGMVVIQASIV